MNKQTLWYPLNEIPQGLWTADERGWLLHPGSLTQRLREVTGGLIQHRLLWERFEIPGEEELAIIDISPQTVALVREIDWWHCGQLWVAARVIIPARTLEAKGYQLKTVGERSLGDILFADGDLSRSDFEFAQIAKGHPYFHRISPHLLNEGKAAWARRSLFYFDGNPLLVSEIFLPALFSNADIP